MSQYPFRHSTYFTGRDPVYTSELPPMNSTEDILQDIFMHDRNTVYAAKPRATGLRKIVKSLKDWRNSTSSLVLLPRAVRRSGFYY